MLNAARGSATIVLSSEKLRVAAVAPASMRPPWFAAPVTSYERPSGASQEVTAMVSPAAAAAGASVSRAKRRAGRRAMPTRLCAWMRCSVRLPSVTSTLLAYSSARALNTLATSASDSDPSDFIVHLPRFIPHVVRQECVAAHAFEHPFAGTTRAPFGRRLGDSEHVCHFRNR